MKLPVLPPMTGVVSVRRGRSYIFWPEEHVAMLRDEGTGRIEVSSADGEVAFCLGTTADFAHGPWTQVAHGVLVHPAHVQAKDGALLVPGGWRVPFDGRLPAVNPPAEEAPMSGTTLRRSEVVELRWDGRTACWITDRGEIPTGCKFTDAVELHGDIMQISRAYINRGRVRTLSGDGRGATIVLDNGRSFLVRTPKVISRIRENLGLPPREKDEGLSLQMHEMFTLELRDYPFELLEASAQQLHDLFAGNAFHLIAHVIWQTVRMRRAGLHPTYGTSERGYWYRPLLPILARAGHLQEHLEIFGVNPDKIGHKYSKAGLYLLYLRVLGHMIGQFRLCTFADVGITTPALICAAWARFVQKSSS